MRKAAEAQRRWRVLTDQFQFPALTELRQALRSKSKDRASPCEDGLRSICWRAFLLRENVDQPSSWIAQIDASREAYATLRNHFLKYIEHPDDLPSTTDPLAEDEESPWQALRKDENSRTEIYQDVERCLQENHFFREPTTKSRMLDILFIYARLNPDLGYRQGMHELLAPVLWVVAHDAVDKASLDDASPSTINEALLHALDSDFIEHDAFTLFCAIMQTAKQFYEQTSEKNPGATQETSAIVSRSHRIHRVVLRGIDADLADHLQVIEILPQIFLTRWIRLLFGREFSFQDTLSIWDLLFAEGLRLDLIDLISVAMLLRIRQRLLKADYSSALGLLLRYPSPEPHAPLDFVLDALFLEQNLAPEGAASLVSKYSGYAPGHFHGKSTDSATLRATPRAADYWKDVIESRHRLPDSPSGRSPIRIGQKGLESLLQDVSSGLSRRTEGWAVAQVVRGAVGEAKRNLRNIQSTASSPALIHTERLRSGSPSPVRLSLDTPRELESRIIAAENLNRSLAKLLEDSLTKLRAHETKMKLNLDESAQAEIAGALNKIDDVRNRLQTPLSSVLPTASDNVTSEPKRASPKIPKAAENIGSLTPPSLPSMPKSDDLVSSRREERTAISPPPRQTGSAAARPRSSAPIRPSARTPLADSPLSWMLGDGRAPSGFTACASAPPERNRKAGGDGRPNYLFGDGGRDEVGTVPTAGDDDGVDLDSLRGALGGK